MVALNFEERNVEYQEVDLAGMCSNNVYVYKCLCAFWNVRMVVKH